MATIPLGQGRRVLPGRAPAQGANPGAYGMQTARAVEQLGNIGANAALQVMDDQHRAELADIERQRQISQAATRQRDLLTLQETQDRLREAHDELDSGIQSGAVPKGDAERMWLERSGEAVTQAVGQVSPDNQDLVRRQLGGTAASLGRGVRKSVEKRDQHDIRTGIDQTLEYQSRQYSTDPAKATQMVMDTLQQMGPFSGLQPDEIARKGQAWKESAQFTRAYSAVSAGRDDRKALDAAQLLIDNDSPDLDPQKKAQLSDRVQAYRLNLDQKAEMAAQRRQREADAHLKRAEAAFNTYMTMADKGTMLDPAYTDQVLQQTRGTPFQSGVVELARQAATTGGLAAQPIAVQQRELDALNAEIAKNGLTPALSKRRDQASKVLTGSQGDLDRDGLRAGLERGVIREIAPLNFTGGLPGVVQQLQERVPQAQRVSTWAGRPVSVLTTDEAGTMAQQLAALAPKDRATMTASIAGVIGPQASQALVQQLAPKDNAMALAFGYAGSQTTNGRLVSELIYRGQQAKADGTSTKGAKQPDLKAASWKADLANDLAEVYPSQQQANQVLEAALLMTHATAAEQGGELTKQDRERMVRMAVGGAVVDLNGRKVPTPFAEDGAESKLNRRLNSVTSQELAPQVPGGQVLAAGVPMPVDDFVKALPGQQLVYAGPNRYAVLVGGRPVKNTAGRNIIIEVR